METEQGKRETLRRMQAVAETVFLKKLDELDGRELEYVLARAVAARIAPAWKDSRRGGERKAYYFSAEYLIGRMVFHNLYALDILEEASELLGESGADASRLRDVEDAVIGNGGLGRLAACFLDSATVRELPMVGYGIKYRYGLFHQKIEDGFQAEEADDWKGDFNPWFFRRENEGVDVTFADQTVRAVPCDMPVIGYRANRVNTLRLWQAEAPSELDFRKFNGGDYAGAVRERYRAEMITFVLYPNDDTKRGKQLRLKQQYFFCSASLQDMLRGYKKTHNTGSLEQFAKTAAIQLNDTHPVVAIPEFIRLAMLDGASFEDAFFMARDIFGYTNHTVMAEALEKWDVKLFKKLLPDVYRVIERINGRLLKEFEGDPRLGELEILHGGHIHMARLAVYGSSHVNGVAKIHTEILKDRVLDVWYEKFPERFSNKTNGVTQRRWLALANRELSGLITSKAGDGWIKDFSQISRLERCIDDNAFVMAFNEVKHRRKVKLAEYVKERDGLLLCPDTVYDIQIKRLHEYKRQLLNAFSVMDFYFRMKDGELGDIPPVSFIFGAKAAPGYYIAKSVIKYINEVGRLIARDGEISKRLAVCFVSNYDVPYAERLFPAADISEQISTAGTEASGTGNMKFMMNGAVTLGTMDGANVEIFEQAGEENNYVFGARVGEIEALRHTYDPRGLYEGNPRLRRVADTLTDGTLSDGGTGMFRDLYRSLLSEEPGADADPYRVLLDFESYTETKLRALADYTDRLGFGRKCLYNIARSGVFSSDRCIREYADDIWKL